MRADKQCGRVLTIDPFQRGFGFAVLEGPEELIDWGLREARKEKNETCLKQIAILIERYCPDIIVIENYRDKNCRRSARIKELLNGIAALALSKKVRLKRVSPSVVRTRFSQHLALSKHQIATEIAMKFPELAALVPPPRKPWMAQDVRMSIFDALALTLVFPTIRKRKNENMPP